MDTILIVDDNPTNLEVLSTVLKTAGYEILVAIDGESAIEQVDYAQPDLILLDVMMPGMDGFETCAQLKAQPNTTSIPVIFMTALADTVDKVKGLNLGAVDYITKPFQTEEVVARIQTHLRIQALTQQLASQNHLLKGEIENRMVAEAALENLVNELEDRVTQRTQELLEKNQQLQRSEIQLQARTQELEQSLEVLQQTQAQLIQSEKISALGQLVAGVAHEINNPVNFIYGNCDYARDYVADLLGLIRAYESFYPNPEPALVEKIEATDLEFIIDDLPKIIDSMKLGADRIRSIVSSLRNFSRMDEAEFKTVDIHEGIESTLMILQHRLKPQQSTVQVVRDYDDRLPLVACYPGQLNQVFMNLLSNAIDALEELGVSESSQDSSKVKQITIRTQAIDGDTVAISIRDNGPGMSEAVQKHLFEAFFTTKPVGQGTGLGLSISHQIIVEKHHGRLAVQSQVGEGTEFTIEIPIAQGEGEAQA